MSPQKSIKRRRRRWVLFGVIFSLVSFFLLFQNSCVSTISPPSDPPDLCRVYLLTEAKHGGIILPDFDGGFVEYGFGDWDWYALVFNRWYHVFDTLLWPTQGCLGRRWLEAGELNRILKDGKLQVVKVGCAKTRALLEELNHRFNQNSSTMINNRQYRMDFVQDQRSFWFLYNCHDATAEWMTQLGCEVTWVPVRFGLKIEKP